MTTDWVQVYKGSCYAFPWRGAWRRFALNGEDALMPDLDESVTLITAWNPNSEDHPLPWNRAANARLLRAVVGQAVPWAPAWGGSLPGVLPAWKEEGYALFGLPRQAACHWGREWGQKALVWLDSNSSELLFVREGRAVPCGLRRIPEDS